MHEEFMREALALALEARARRSSGGRDRGHGREIVGRGATPDWGERPQAHAEMLALREACGRIGNYRLPGAVVYSTLEPCVMCAGALVGGPRAILVFATRDLRLEASAASSS